MSITQKDMRIFVRNGLLFVLLLVFLFMLFNFIYIHKVYEKKIFYRKELQYRDSVNTTLTYAFFGDSHAINAINPAYVPDSFNFGMNGENYIESYYRLRKMVTKDHVTFRYAVLETDMHTFSSSRIRSGEQYKELYVTRQWASYPEMRAVTNRSVGALWFLSHFPVLGEGSDLIVNTIHPPELTEMNRGWLRNDDIYSEKNMTRSAEERFNNQFGNETLVSEVTLEYFLKTVRLCEAHNITIIFIMYPVTELYHDLFVTNNISRRDFYDQVFARVNAVGTNYTVLDYNDLYFDSVKYFGDQDHLNTEGSTVFSKKVAEDLEKYADRNQSITG
jgi:hypothetical protein